MIRLYCILLLFFPKFIFAQTAPTIPSVYTWDENLREVTTVLSDDPRIYHGAYRLEGEHKKVLLEGFYKFGMKDSLWKSYWSKTSQPKVIGNYLYDAPVGVWEFHNEDGTVSSKYDFTTQEYVAITSSDPIPSFPDTLHSCSIPEHQTLLEKEINDALMYSALRNFIKYPNSEKENGVQGKLVVGFTINKDGIPDDYKIVKSVSYLIDVEGLRIASKLKCFWLPQIIDGKPTSYEFSFPISFSLK